MHQLILQQQQQNQVLNQTLTQSANYNMQQLSIMQQLAHTMQQNQYQHLFNNIPTYNGTNKDKFFHWLDELQGACLMSGQDCRLEAFVKSAGKVKKYPGLNRCQYSLVQGKKHANKRILSPHYTSPCMCLFR